MMSKPQSEACRTSFGALRAAYRGEIETLVKATMGYDAVKTPSDDSFKIGMVLVCALFTGPHYVFISRLTGIPRGQCQKWEAKARRIGIFARDGIYAGPWEGDPDDKESVQLATLQFTLDVLCVGGSIKREGPRGPDAMYSAS